MASDDIPEAEQPEIIPKPPSHPITTSLLITSSVAAILTIGLAQNMLFGRYVLSPKGPKEVGMDLHGWEKEKNLPSGPIDHYKQDFPEDAKLMEYNVKKELHILETPEAGGAGAGDR